MAIYYFCTGAHLHNRFKKKLKTASFKTLDKCQCK